MNIALRHHCSVTKSCPTICDPMDCSTSGSPVLHWVCSNSCPLSWWCHPSISPSVVPFSCPQSFPASVFWNEVALRIRWPKYWSFNFSVSPSNECSGLISFRIDWFDLQANQGTLKSLLQSHSWKASILILEMGNGEGNGTPLQYSCLENPMDRGAWWGCSPWGC